MPNNELKPEDFETPEAEDKARARLLAEHFNMLHRISLAELDRVYRVGLANAEMVRDLTGITSTDGEE